MADSTPQPILEGINNFGIREVDFKRPSVAGTAATNQTPIPMPAPLGPLTAFVGSWKGRGFNTIFRPNSSASPTFPAPLDNSDNVLELNLTEEVLSFSPNLDKIPNRGSGSQSDLILNGVPYVQSINDVTSDPPNGIHFEPGIWLHIPATDSPQEPITLARMASIPHGTTINSQGVVLATLAGPPTIAPIDITPFQTGNPTSKIPFPSQTVTNDATARLPQQLGPFVADGRITQAIVNDPNTVLREQIAQQNIIDTVVIAISTNPAAPLAGGPLPDGSAGAPPPSLKPDVGGGPANIAFLSPPAGGGSANALGTQMDALFWIETVLYDVEVPPLSADLPPVILTLPPTSPPSLQPKFSASIISNDGKTFAGGIVRVSAVQIQYSQKVILRFAGLDWPHVSVATLLPSDPVPIPTELLPLT